MLSNTKENPTNPVRQSKVTQLFGKPIDTSYVNDIATPWYQMYQGTKAPELSIKQKIALNGYPDDIFQTTVPSNANSIIHTFTSAQKHKLISDESIDEFLLLKMGSKKQLMESKNISNNILSGIKDKVSLIRNTVKSDTKELNIPKDITNFIDADMSQLITLGDDGDYGTFSKNYMLRLEKDPWLCVLSLNIEKLPTPLRSLYAALIFPLSSVANMQTSLNIMCRKLETDEFSIALSDLSKDDLEKLVSSTSNAEIIKIIDTANPEIISEFAEYCGDDEDYMTSQILDACYTLQQMNEPWLIKAQSIKGNLFESVKTIQSTLDYWISSRHPLINHFGFNQLKNTIEVFLSKMNDIDHSKFIDTEASDILTDESRIISLGLIDEDDELRGFHEEMANGNGEIHAYNLNLEHDQIFDYIYNVILAEHLIASLCIDL